MSPGKIIFAVLELFTMRFKLIFLAFICSFIAILFGRQTVKLYGTAAARKNHRLRVRF